MNGILLDPRTGMPEDPGAHERHRRGLYEHVLENLARARTLGADQPQMSKQGFNEVLACDIADGTQILNTTSETIVCPDYSFAANDSHIYPGAIFRTTCYFDCSFVITTPGTLILALRWGGVAGTVLATSGAYAPDPTAALANRSGWVEFLTVWRTIGSAGSAMTMGKMGIADVDDASATTLQGNLNMFVIPASAPAAVGSLDTTTSKLLSVTAKFSVNTATTQYTNHIRLLESLN